MNLHKLLLTKNVAYTEAKKITPCGPLWHSTGANNPFLKRYVGPDDGKLGHNPNGNHWNKPNFRKCGHAMIGKLQCGTVATYQTLPWDYRCMLSGSPDPVKDKVKKDPRGNANDLGYIQFEICEDGLNNKDYAMAVYKEAVELSAYLCKMLNLDPLGKNRWGLPVVLDHASAHKLGLASNHGDVLHWFGRYGITLAKIRQDIATAMGQQPTPAPEPEPGKCPYKIRLTKGTPYYEKPDNKSKVKGKVEATTNYTIVEESGIYGKLKSGAGWVQVRDEPAPGKFPYKIRLTKGTPYYEKPDNKSKVAGKVEATTNYTIVDEYGIYGKLKSGAGWVQLKEEPKPEPGKFPYKIKLTKGTPYYVKPDNTSKVAGKVEATTNYTIVEESGVYGKLKSGAGWVQLSGAPPVPTFRPYVVKVLSNVLNIRQQPTTGSKIVGTVRKGSAYTIMEEKSGQGSKKGWGRLKSGAGWIALDFVEFLRYA